MVKRWVTLASSLLLLVLLLTSCYLVSGERVETTPWEGMQAGLYTVRFVSADGEVRRTIETGVPLAPFVVEVSVQTQQGELVVVVLDSTQTNLITVTARLGIPGVGQTEVYADEDGRLLLHVKATEARSGVYTVSYRLAAPLTPTPTPTRTPLPTATPTPGL